MGTRRPPHGREFEYFYDREEGLYFPKNMNENMDDMSPYQPRPGGSGGAINNYSTMSLQLQYGASAIEGNSTMQPQYGSRYGNNMQQKTAVPQAYGTQMPNSHGVPLDEVIKVVEVAAKAQMEADFRARLAEVKLQAEKEKQVMLQAMLQAQLEKMTEYSPANMRLCKAHFTCSDELEKFQLEPDTWPDWCLDLCPEAKLKELIQIQHDLDKIFGAPAYDLAARYNSFLMKKARVRGAAAHHNLVGGENSRIIKRKPQAEEAEQADAAWPADVNVNASNVLPKYQYKWPGANEPLMASEIKKLEDNFITEFRLIARLWTASLKVGSPEYKDANARLNKLLNIARDSTIVESPMAQFFMDELVKSRAKYQQQSTSSEAKVSSANGKGKAKVVNTQASQPADNGEGSSKTQL